MGSLSSLPRDTRAVYRRRFAAVIGAVLALTLGAGPGLSYAYFTSHASGTGSVRVGSPVGVTISAVSGTADLVPGGTGAAYFTLNNNTGLLGASFNEVTAATVTSTSSGSCTASNISFPLLPYTFSPAVTVGANTTSGSQSIPAVVTLSAAAPNACQGVTFALALTLSGKTT